jgi:hypothetical protein
MPQAKPLKIRRGSGYEVISEEDFDPTKHELLVGEGEIVVKPLNVEKAKPFIIDERDFDPRSYERVNQTAAVAAEIAKQTDRQTLPEEIASRTKTVA